MKKMPFIINLFISLMIGWIGGFLFMIFRHDITFESKDARNFEKRISYYAERKITQVSAHQFFEMEFDKICFFIEDEYTLGSAREAWKEHFSETGGYSLKGAIVIISLINNKTHSDISFKKPYARADGVKYYFQIETHLPSERFRKCIEGADAVISINAPSEKISLMHREP